MSKTSDDSERTAEDRPEPAGAGKVPAPALGFRRERAVAILSEAFARNLMSIEEFERRVAVAHGATTLAELDRLVDDIPEEFHAISVRPEARAADGTPRERAGAADGIPAGASRRKAAARTPPARGPRDIRELDSEEQGVQGVMMTRSLRGDWLKSRVVAVRTLMSTTELDFRDVEMPPGEIEIRVACLMSSVVITVPEELPVQADVTPVLGEVRLARRVSAPSARYSGPSLRLTGVAVMSEVKIRAR